MTDDTALRAAAFADLIQDALATLNKARTLAYEGPLPRDTTTTFNMVSLDRVDEAIYQLRTAMAGSSTP